MRRDAMHLHCIAFRVALSTCILRIPVPANTPKLLFLLIVNRSALNLLLNTVTPFIFTCSRRWTPSALSHYYYVAVGQKPTPIITWYVTSDHTYVCQLLRERVDDVQRASTVGSMPTVRGLTVHDDYILLKTSTMWTNEFVPFTRALVYGSRLAHRLAFE